MWNWWTRQTRGFVAALWIGFAPVADGAEADWIIALDIGHTPSNPGAISSRGVPEYVFNRQMVGVLLHHLRQQGFTGAFVVNEDNPELTLGQRAVIANARDADVFLSIHHDSVQPQYLRPWKFKGTHQRYMDRFQGYSIFFSSLNGQPEQSEHLAETLGSILLRHDFQPTLHHAEPIPGENRPLTHPLKGIYQFDQLAVLRQTQMPAILLECGVILNRAEEKRLGLPETRAELARAIVDALKLFFTSVTT